ncbi:Crp/FNR family transcriptional regulator [uncultured Alphaproteobacteria bacterium]|uniref:Crp/FNR family transcriptional regulator n=1 Tax=uncultured Alphaproteobacteria bacterium TaxID=91750 RepID=A0A212KME1_9PROT|nr:Crp/FNR family transcriptional regulator [uncultured Alphaproteobacteria bacterium]
MDDPFADPAAIRAALARGTWFRALPEAIADALVAAATVERVPEGAAIHHFGDGSDALYAVLAGTVKVSSVSTEGRECVFRHLLPGDWFGEIGVLDGGGRTHDAVTIADTCLLVVPPHRVAEILDRYPLLYRFLALLLCRVVRTAFTMLTDTTLLSLDARLAKRLLSFARAATRAGDDELVVRLTQEQIAALCGATRQAVNIRLARWRKRGWIELGYGALRVRDLAALERLADAP